MPETSDVAVVIPTYNRKALLSRAVMCAALQTLPPREIIVVDDGSTDGTEEEIYNLRKHLSHIGQKSAVVYFRQPTNCGANCARNKGISLASSKYIAFLDSDDIWHEKKLEIQINQANKTGGRNKLSFTDRIRMNDELEATGYCRSPIEIITRDHIITSNKIGPLSSVIIERELLEKIGGFDESLRACQDWDVYIRALEHTDGLRIPQPLIAYFDCRIPRISSNYRARIQARVGIHRRYAKGRLCRSKKFSYYINISDDLNKIGKTNLSKKFFIAYCMSKKRVPFVNFFQAHIKYHIRRHGKQVHNPHCSAQELDAYNCYYKALISRLGLREYEQVSPSRQESFSHANA